MEILLDTEIQALQGEEHLEALELLDKPSGEVRTLPVDGLFREYRRGAEYRDVCAGNRLSPDGRILAGEDCRTNLPGVYAAGDVR